MVSIAATTINYTTKYFEIPAAGCLSFMEVNNLNQKDLSSIFGNQGNVSKFLNGERSLSKLQIVGLKKRFLISADFFLRC